MTLSRSLAKFRTMAEVMELGTVTSEGETATAGRGRWRTSGTWFAFGEDQCAATGDWAGSRRASWGAAATGRGEEVGVRAVAEGVERSGTGSRPRGRQSCQSLAVTESGRGVTKELRMSPRFLTWGVFTDTGLQCALGFCQAMSPRSDG